MGKVHFASSTVHSPWTALRVRWVPLYSFPTLSLRAFAMCAAFLRSDYYAPFDCLQGLGAFGPGLPSLLPTLLAIPFRLSRVQPGGLNQDEVGGVLLAAPSALCGSPVPTQGKTGLPVSPPHGSSSMFWSLLPPDGHGFGLCWLTYQARFVRVLIHHRAMHASCESPYYLSTKHDVLRACLPLTAPFRSMLLTP